VANLVELRKPGYMAEWCNTNDLETNTGYHFMLTEHNCAISNVAESFPSVCGHELQMFATVLPDCTVERTHWIINGEHRCGYLFKRRETLSMNFVEILGRLNHMRSTFMDSAHHQRNFLREESAKVDAVLLSSHEVLTRLDDFIFKVS